MTKLLLTRRFPGSIPDQASAAFDTTIRESEEGMSPDECAAVLRDYDAILATLGDQFSAAAFEGDVRCKMIGNFGVGYNHIDVDAAQKAGVTASNRPSRPYAPNAPLHPHGDKPLGSGSSQCQQWHR